MSTSSEEADDFHRRHHRHTPKNLAVAPPQTTSFSEESFVRFFSRDRGHLNDFLKGLKNLDQVDVFGNTLLHYAVFFHDLDVVKQLLQLGVNPCPRDRGNWDTIQLAIAGRDAPILLELELARAAYLDGLIRRQTDIFLQAVEAVPDFELVFKWQVFKFPP